MTYLGDTPQWLLDIGNTVTSFISPIIKEPGENIQQAYTQAASSGQRQEASSANIAYANMTAEQRLAFQSIDAERQKRQTLVYGSIFLVALGGILFFTFIRPSKKKPDKSILY